MNPQNRLANERWIVVVAVLASSMAFIDATAVNVVLPSIQSELAASGPELLWIVNAYSLVTAALILFGGVIGDHFGRVKMFALGISVFITASLACGAASTAEWMIVARAVQGLGAAIMIPGSLSLISTTFDASRRGRAVGIWSACSVVMAALGPIAGGLFADAGWWRGIFLINLPIGLVLLVVLATKITAARSNDLQRIDYLGALLAIVVLASLNVGLIELPGRGWDDPIILASLGTCAISFLAFAGNECCCRCPLVPLKLFRDHRFLASSQLMLCFYSGLYGMLFFLSLNLVQVQHYRASAAGLAQLPVMVLVILLSPAAGNLVDRFGPRKLIGCGGALGILGFAMMARAGVNSRPLDYWTIYFPSLVLLGMAMGLCAVPLSTTMMNCVPDSQSGLASGLNSTLSRLASVLGLAVLGSIAIPWFSHSLHQQVEPLGLDKDAMIAIGDQSKYFANAVPPVGLSPATTKAVEDSIRVAFVDSFRAISLISAAVLGASLLIAMLSLKQKKEEHT